MPFLKPKNSLALAKNASTFFSHKTTVNPSKRSFNTKTLENVYTFLKKNRENIQWETNESGFIRTVFPKNIFQPDGTIQELNGDEKLRANFWYYESPADSMGDESIHDHPRPFQSYIINGGYEHEIYSVKDNNDLVVEFSCRTSISIDELKKIIDVYEQSTGISFYHQFELDKNQENRITYKGEKALKLDKIQATKQGDIVAIDDLMIHRVSKFRTDPKVPTASLNIVRNTGKGVTNIFLPNRNESSVKTSRSNLSSEDAKKATDAMIEITENHLNMKR